ncbi:helix-turn-helix domain-containing protein [Streptomyces uncialis]|uniref:ArsR/SmtB family transcription factor n=1 Tax=Streptomyces uncialis TaxID=1048205 RepID=UPI002E352139|nr:helix-turn-helix domain-containing protein [Streptomyces uncialis]
MDENLPGAPGTTAPATTERKIRQLDARSLRGLAHPLRMELLTALRRGGPATASQLASRLGESSGSTSYHLRQLAEYGFVEDAPEQGKGRERWWRSTHEGTDFGHELMGHQDPEVRGAVDVFLHWDAHHHNRELTTWIATRADWSEEWVSASDMSDFTLRLTPEQGGELSRRVHELIESYRRSAPPVDGDAETAQMRIHLHAFPQPES